MSDAEIEGTYEKRHNVGFLAFLMLCMFAFFGWLTSGVSDRVKSIEKIVGTEAPASMTWTNGHLYTSIVKHSHNCGCVKK